MLQAGLLRVKTWAFKKENMYLFFLESASFNVNTALILASLDMILYNCSSISWILL